MAELNQKTGRTNDSSFSAALKRGETKRMLRRRLYVARDRYEKALHAPLVAQHASFFGIPEVFWSFPLAKVVRSALWTRFFSVRLSLLEQ